MKTGEKNGLPISNLNHGLILQSTLITRIFKNIYQFSKKNCSNEYNFDNTGTFLNSYEILVLKKHNKDTSRYISYVENT